MSLWHLVNAKEGSVAWSAALKQTHSITFPFISAVKCLQDQFWVINSKHGHFLLNRFPARFLPHSVHFFLHTGPVILYRRLQWNVYNRDGAMALSRCVQVLSPLHTGRICRNEDLTALKQTRGNNRLLVCVSKSWHSPSFFQGHLHWYTFCSLNASLSIRIKMPQWNTHTHGEHISSVEPSLSLIA